MKSSQQVQIAGWQFYSGGACLNLNQVNEGIWFLGVSPSDSGSRHTLQLLASSHVLALAAGFPLLSLTLR